MLMREPFVHEPSAGAVLVFHPSPGAQNSRLSVGWTSPEGARGYRVGGRFRRRSAALARLAQGESCFFESLQRNSGGISFHRTVPVAGDDEHIGKRANRCQAREGERPDPT